MFQITTHVEEEDFCSFSLACGSLAYIYRIVTILHRKMEERERQRRDIGREMEGKRKSRKRQRGRETEGRYRRTKIGRERPTEIGSGEMGEKRGKIRGMVWRREVEKDGRRETWGTEIGGETKGERQRGETEDKG
jgi:hypothetical protein